MTVARGTVMLVVLLLATATLFLLPLRSRTGAARKKGAHEPASPNNAHADSCALCAISAMSRTLKATANTGQHQSPTEWGASPRWRRRGGRGRRRSGAVIRRQHQALPPPTLVSPLPILPHVRPTPWPAYSDCACCGGRDRGLASWPCQGCRKPCHEIPGRGRWSGRPSSRAVNRAEQADKPLLGSGGRD